MGATRESVVGVADKPVLVQPGDASMAEWLAARRNGIGASEVGAVCGLSPYEGQLRVWLRKVTDMADEDNMAMKLGRLLEDDVLELYGDEHPGHKVTPKPGLFAHPDAPWRLCTPDALARDDDGPLYLEAKTGMSYLDGWGEPGTDEIPPYYLAQVTWGADIMGIRRWVLAVLLLDQREFREFRGDVDDEFAALLHQRVDSFWHHNVLAGVEPTADGLADTAALLADRSVRDETPCDLPDEAKTWLLGYRINHQAIAEREQAKAEYANLLRQWLVQHESSIGYLDGEKVVTYKRGAKSTALRVKGVTW